MYFSLAWSFLTAEEEQEDEGREKDDSSGHVTDNQEFLIDCLALVTIIDYEKRISNVWCYFHNKTIRTGLSKGYL